MSRSFPFSMFDISINLVDVNFGYRIFMTYLCIISLFLDNVLLICLSILFVYFRQVGTFKAKSYKNIIESAAVQKFCVVLQFSKL